MNLVEVFFILNSGFSGFTAGRIVSEHMGAPAGIVCGVIVFAITYGLLTGIGKVLRFLYAHKVLRKMTREDINASYFHMS
ncbi:MAG: hypothetical protein ACAI35_11890 [Candidatus Methylacidiphilales bacterium]|nr:hypothetical protein [Candidatus Methylacidiphilales bacterium]